MLLSIEYTLAEGEHNAIEALLELTDLLLLKLTTDLVEYVVKVEFKLIRVHVDFSQLRSFHHSCSS